MERILNQITPPINKNKWKVIAQYWEHNLEEIGKISMNCMILHQEDKDNNSNKAREISCEMSGNPLLSQILNSKSS
jgi:hypothetical protein